MLYLVGALGIGGVIVTLLMLYYRQQSIRYQREKELVSTDRDAWRRIYEAGEQLRDEVDRAKRTALESERSNLLERLKTVRDAKPGEVIEDALGARKPAGEGRSAL
jgi:hypothetical protein